MKTLLDAIGPAVANLRKSAGITQRALSENAGLDQSDISRIENGRQGVSIESINSLADALGVRVSELFQEAERILEGRSGEVRRTGELLVDDPGKAAARIANDIDAIRYALGAICSVIAATRPDEGVALSSALSLAPEKFLRNEGMIPALVQAVESAAKQAKNQLTSRQPAKLES